MCSIVLLVDGDVKTHQQYLQQILIFFLQITTSHFSSERIPVLGEECLLSLARLPHTRTWFPEATAYKQQVLA